MIKKVIIGRIVNRFLGWELPDDFCPDCGISFNKKVNIHIDGKLKETDRREAGPCWWPVGTNLFTADQTEAMLNSVAGEEIEFLLRRLADVSESERSCNKLLVREGQQHRIALERIRELETKLSLYEELEVAAREYRKVFSGDFDGVKMLAVKGNLDHVLSAIDKVRE